MAHIDFLNEGTERENFAHKLNLWASLFSGDVFLKQHIRPNLFETVNLQIIE